MIPVILDTDIGDDIDDSWALIMLLKMPRLDCRLITTTFGYVDFRTRLLAKYLTIANRRDIPIGRGTGPDHPDQGKRLLPWDDFPLEKYDGTIHADGPRALIEAIHQSPEPITLIANGPLHTISDALIIDPSIASKTHFVAMQGSVRLGYRGSPEPVPEHNVKSGIPQAKHVFSAPWKSMAITPLDTCGTIDLAGDRYQRLRDSNDPLIKALLESEVIWRGADAKPWSASSTLFDCVSVYMADREQRSERRSEPCSLLNFERLRIAIDDTGRTVESPAGQEMDVALSWRDEDAFRDLLLQILLDE